MESAPAIDDAAPVVAGEIFILPPAEIIVGERLRAVDMVHAEAVGWSMVKDGQINPIEVCRMPGRADWHLAGPGGHRLAGARVVGMDGIECREVSSSKDSRRLREAVENLFRRDLDPIDRAATIAELVHLKRTRAGLDTVARRDAQVGKTLKRAISEEADTNLETISRLYGWTDEVGAELGFTGRTIRNDLMLYRSLTPSLVARLRDFRHPVLKNAAQLRQIAKLGPADQRDVVDSLIGDGAWEKCATVREALAQTGPAKKPADPDAKRLSAFLGAFQRMGLAERKAAIAALLPLVPAGCLPEASPATAAPSADRSTAELIDLGIDAIADGIAEEMDPDWIAGDLTRRFGARVQFGSGTYELRLGGVAGTSTAGGLPMLQSWVRAAQKHRDRAAA